MSRTHERRRSVTFQEVTKNLTENAEKPTATAFSDENLAHVKRNFLGRKTRHHFMWEGG